MLQVRLKRLVYQLRYRGMKELDIFFAKAIRGLDQLDNEDYVLLNQLIDESEEKIYSWLLGQEHNSKYKKIIEKILTFG